MTPLTKKEEQHLKLFAEGKTAKGVAKSMNVSENTVKDRCQAIYRKLGASTSAQAVYIAAKAGVI